MHFTALTSIAAATVGTVAVVATGTILAFSPPSDGPDVWFDFPVAAGTIYSGPVVVSAHTNAPKSTAIVVTLSQKGAVVTALTDSTLEHSGSGSGADILFTASSEWDAPVGVYDVSAQVYNGSSVVKEEKSKLTVVAFTPRSPIGIPGGSLDPDPTASPSPSASPSASATASPSASATPDATPTATSHGRPRAARPSKGDTHSRSTKGHAYA